MISNNHFASSTLANYIVWNVIQDEVSFLSKPYRDARTKYRERVLGSKGQKKRWKTCVTFTNELLGDILGSAYVEHHFSKESKKMVRSFEKRCQLNITYVGHELEVRESFLNCSYLAQQQVIHIS